MVGFNRRFAPMVVKMQVAACGCRRAEEHGDDGQCRSVPNDHWTQDPTIGGGRIVGEACHFIDLLRYLAGLRSTRST